MPSPIIILVSSHHRIFLRCTFVQAAADNNDINEETLDGKHTTHSTTVVLYQKGQFGPKQKRQRRAYIRNTCVRLTMLNCQTYGKKPSVMQHLNQIIKDWYHVNTSQDEWTILYRGLHMYGR